MSGLYNSRWQKARLTFLAKNPLCVYCLKDGRITEATRVDHIEPHRDDYKKFWDTTNWQPLCITHHQATKQAMERGKNVRSVGLDGWPID